MDVGDIYLIIALFLLLVSFFKDKGKTREVLKVVYKTTLTVFPVLFMIFILMGTISVFVSKETIAHWLGSGSGVWGILIGELVGAFALVQPAAVFPFSGMLLNKGASYATIFAFVSTAILIGVSTLPAEIKFFGKRITIVRNLLTFFVVFIFSIFVQLILK
jgi:uncharacterized membrane protein YraQ (UPF0718 family)